MTVEDSQGHLLFSADAVEIAPYPILMRMVPTEEFASAIIPLPDRSGVLIIKLFVFEDDPAVSIL